MSTDRYLVTARKYRPKRFDEVVAQKHVSDTLKNAIRQDRLAHAYLFSGPRGVGKTTAARVLAKAINCTTPLAERPDGSEPCLECDSCKSFAEGRSLNVIEIDAASNRGVDDARELRDTVRIPPQGARKKVYIVDEVHMLTKEAFNTLLKTLEEPPAHALFILATTEPHKVLATIVSRCQRFDFRRISVVEIVRRLEEIARLEDVVADEASLLLIARKGDGALRDSLSVFDQAVSLCGSNLEYQVLADALGVVDADFFFEASGFARDGDAAGMMRLVQRLVAEGYYAPRLGPDRRDAFGAGTLHAGKRRIHTFGPAAIAHGRIRNRIGPAGQRTSAASVRDGPPEDGQHDPESRPQGGGDSDRGDGTKSIHDEGRDGVLGES
jgi:DNA polymerase-3 subunit gamma/tau